MTPEEQQIAIAEACGWTNICLQPLWVSDIEDEFPPVLCGTHPSKGRPEGIPKRFGPLPDYLNDLNAMHDAEKVLINDQDLKYSESLALVVKARWKTNNSYDMQKFRSATAAQRARAFLETLGLWDNGSSNN